jgi:hypothetical protein
MIKEVSNSCEHPPAGGLSTFRPLPESELEPLPPKDMANEYIATYFDTFNTSFPLYDEESVMERFAKDYYMVSRERDPAWYASLNVMFLIGRSIGTHEKGPGGVCEKYFQNATSVLPELLFNGPSLMAVQAMIGLVCFPLEPSYSLTNDTRPSSYKHQRIRIHRIY